MTVFQQLTILRTPADNQKKYNADGVIRLHALYDIEVVLLGALFPILKNAADTSIYASDMSFMKLKIYFMHASDEHIRLWSIKYLSNDTYTFNREARVKNLEDKDEVDQSLVPLLDFFFYVKVSRRVCGSPSSVRTESTPSSLSIGMPLF
ncbi:hypothetical protein CLU79DRAFT_830789 [Phycomyces nitens]|nr:hypothetical protein CLU79DRAFT_830789 [Phycomyces nitens]